MPEQRAVEVPPYTVWENAQWVGTYEGDGRWRCPDCEALLPDVQAIAPHRAVMHPKKETVDV